MRSAPVEGSRRTAVAIATTEGPAVIVGFERDTNELPRIELLIRILPGGMMSDWLVNRASVDDVVDVSGPYGQFFLKEKVRAPHVMIAGGTGLAPMLSMIDALRLRLLKMMWAGQRRPSPATFAWRRWLVRTAAVLPRVAPTNRRTADQRQPVVP